MCGITTIYSLAGQENQDKNIRTMNETLLHRGPDDSGYYSYEKKIYFGHQRLSIIDLSPAGHQPMSNEDGAIWHVKLNKYELLQIIDPCTKFMNQPLRNRLHSLLPIRKCNKYSY